MENNIFLTQTDFDKLSSLIRNSDSEMAELLEAELNRASIVSEEQLPKDIVSMNSKVSYVDLDSGKESVITLVYPHDANTEENKISVLAPIGSALIGLKVDQNIQWPLPSGKQKRIKVTAILSQG